MIRTEVSQLAVSSPNIAEVLDMLDPDQEPTDELIRRRLLERLAREPQASDTLRRLARERLDDMTS